MDYNGHFLHHDKAISCLLSSVIYLPFALQSVYTRILSIRYACENAYVTSPVIKIQWTETTLEVNTKRKDLAMRLISRFYRMTANRSLFDEEDDDDEAKPRARGNYSVHLPRDNWTRIYTRCNAFADARRCWGRARLMRWDAFAASFYRLLKLAECPAPKSEVCLEMRPDTGIVIGKRTWREVTRVQN